VTRFHLALAGALMTFAGPALADVPSVVENPATPAEGVVSVDAELLWRVGGLSEDYLFGIVDASAVADDGTTYLLDEQLSQVTAIDLEGHEVNTFGREGEGPGEMTGGQRIMVLGDGRVGVLNMRPPKIITYDADGMPAGDISLAGNEGLNFASNAFANDESIFVETKNMGFNEKTQTSTDALRILDPQTGEFVGEVLSKVEESDRLGEGGRMVVMIGDNFLSSWTLFDDGRVAVVRDDDVYEIEILDSEGNLLRTIRREAEAVRRPQEAIDDDIAERESLAEQAGFSFDEDDIDTHEPMIESVHARANGELWVLTGEGLAHDRDDVVGIFDVFDAEGRFVRQVELKAAFDSANDRFTIDGGALVVYEDLVSARGSGFVIQGSRIAQAEEDETDADPLAIARYRF